MNRSCPTCARPVPRGQTECLYCASVADPPDTSMEMDLPVPDFTGLESNPPTPIRPAAVSSRPPRWKPPPVETKGPSATEEFARQQRRVRVAWVAGLLVVAGVIAFAATKLGVEVWPEDLEVDPALQERFAPAMSSYGEAFARASGGAPRVVGRLLPIEQERVGPTEEEVQAGRAFGGPLAQAHYAWRINDLYNGLPPELVASSPSEVGTLARVTCRPSLVGIYVLEGSETVRRPADSVSPNDPSVAGQAFRWSCEVELVDLASRRVLGSRTFVGGEPPESTFALEDHDRPGEVAVAVSDRFGSRPRAEMLAFLTSLPRE